MTVIMNINDQYGGGLEFAGDTLEEAVAEMQATIRQCGPEFAHVVVDDQDYEIVED